MDEGETPKQCLPRSGKDTTHHKKSYADVVTTDHTLRMSQTQVPKRTKPPAGICRRWHRLNSLIEVVPEGISKCDEQEWEESEMVVDSGATETVVAENMLTSIDTKEDRAYKRGVQYEVASGCLIPNLGERRFVGICEKARHAP